MALPYQGNKQAIANELVLFLRNSFLEVNTFYDLFGGGGNISEVASKHFKNVHYNEILTPIYCAFNSLIDGSFENILPKSEWITRDVFHKDKLLNNARGGLVATCWSFGNDQMSYIYGSEVEEQKRQLHLFCFAENKQVMQDSLNFFNLESNVDYLFNLPAGHQRKLAFKKIIKQKIGLQLQGLESLERLQSLESLETTNISYELVKIEPNSLIYCDIPYDTKHKKGNYRSTFCHDTFYNWALNHNEAVVFSEYLENVPAGFKVIWKRYKQNLFSANSNLKMTECLAWNGKGNFNNFSLFD